MSKKLYIPAPIDKKEKIYDAKRNPTGIRIGITYLDKNRFGLKDLFRAARGNNQYIDDFNELISSARKINDIGEFISAFISHNRGYNDDEISKKKVEQLNNDHNLEIEHMIHLHCKRGGKGDFTVHGFQTDNIFEIVWLDPKHELY